LCWTGEKLVLPYSNCLFLANSL